MAIFGKCRLGVNSIHRHADTVKKPAADCKFPTDQLKSQADVPGFAPERETAGTWRARQCSPQGAENMRLSRWHRRLADDFP
ncbi:MAG: hypothetical protein ACHQF3_11685 [Alphaproteobacteria bacterium]